VTKAIALVALRDLVGGTIPRGRRFETSPVQAAILIRSRSARFATAADVTPEPVAVPQPSRRRYRRRDLVAEA